MRLEALMLAADELVQAVQQVTRQLGERCLATVMENPATGRLFTQAREVGTGGCTVEVTLGSSASPFPVRAGCHPCRPPTPYLQAAGFLPHRKVLNYCMYGGVIRKPTCLWSDVDLEAIGMRFHVCNGACMAMMMGGGRHCVAW